MKKILIFSSIALAIMACGNQPSPASNSTALTSTPSSNTTAAATNSNTSSDAADVQDGPAVSSIETSDYIVKLHRVIPFTLAPKSYQPFKVDPDTKLVALDMSIRNKTGAPINMSKILGMMEIHGAGKTNMVGTWVVAAYMVDHPDAQHQKQYDALWNQQFEGKGFHRAILTGLNPKKTEHNFTLLLPEKADYNAARKSMAFTVE